MHNQKRLLHESPPLEFDEGLAKKLQSALDIASATYNEKSTLNLGTDYNNNCKKNVYKHTDATSKDIKSVAKAAAKNWYSGNTVYNYKNGDTTDEKKLKEYQNFARMMWKSSTKVAFGMVDAKTSDTVWVVGYYCYDAPSVGTDSSTRDIATVKKNVGRYCLVKDANGGGYNDCYNQRALARHNERREGHSGYVPLALDTEIAKAIQA